MKGILIIIKMKSQVQDFAIALLSLVNSLDFTRFGVEWFNQMMKLNTCKK
jgi:hypothetical protein